MKKPLLLIVILVCLGVLNTSAQTLNWSRTVDTIETYGGCCLDGTPIAKRGSDSSIIFLYQNRGNYGGYWNSYDSIRLVKYSFNGDIKWKKKYPLIGGGVIHDLTETPDHGLIMVGEIDTVFSIIKLNSLGDISYIKNFPNPNRKLELKEIIPTRDSNFILISCYYQLDTSVYCSYGVANEEYHSTFVSKIDQAGNIIWHKQFSLDSVMRTSSPAYLNPSYFGSLAERPLVDVLDDPAHSFNILMTWQDQYNGLIYIKYYHVDAGGNILFSKILEVGWLWNNCFQPNKFLVEPTAEGYSIFRQTQEDGAPEYTTIFHFSKLGTLQDTLAYISPQNSQGNPYVLPIMTDGFLETVFKGGHNYHTIASYYHYLSGDFAVIKTDKDLNTLWGEVFNDPETEYVKPVMITDLDDTTLLCINITNHSGYYGDDSLNFIKFYKIGLGKKQLYYTFINDRNNDQIADPTDTSFLFSDILRIKHASATEDHYLSNNSYFSRFSDSGTYISRLFSFGQNLKYCTIFPDSAVSILNSAHTIDTVKFLFHKQANVRDLQVNVITLNCAVPGTASANYVSGKNIGTSTIYSPVISFIKDSRQTFDSTLFIYGSLTINGDTLSWSVDSLAPGELNELFINTNNPSPPDLNINDTLTLQGIIVPVAGDTFPADNFASVKQVVKSAFDPNEKLEAHGSTIDYSAIQRQDYLYYTIHFQNTGNSPATRVVVKDTLTSTLDLASLEMISSSHSYTLSIHDPVLEWTLDPIYLLDSTSSSTESRGYVYFRIKPKSGLSSSAPIENRASIIMDNNSPVFTNTAVTRIIDNRITPVINSTIRSIHLYPSPSSGLIYMEFESVRNSTTELRIVNIKGQEIYKKMIRCNAGKNTEQIDLSLFPAGIYFIRLESDDHILYYGKLVKQ